MSPADAAYAYLRRLAAEVAASGARHVCICPGSRSTPVALAFAQQPALRLWMHLDERSAGYFALGLAKAQRAPAAVVCTSGTAAANLTPAVVEAFHAGVPLLLLTADRPPEVRGWGAAQTVDQLKMFGDHVKWFAEADAGLPHAAAGAASLARRAAAIARAPFPGPVHINLPLREPLLPSALGADPLTAPAVAAAHPACEPPPLPATDRGVIIAGGMDEPAPAIVELANATGWPLLADPLSQLRCGPHHGPAILDSYDACLREPAFASAMTPDIALRFGAPPTSKVLGEWVRAARQQIVVDPGWRDPDLRASVWPHDPQAVAVALCRTARPRGGAYATRWQRADAAARRALRPGADLTEMGIFAQLAQLLPAGAALVAGNSMPVRDMDSFLPGMAKPLRVFANRGANGIDGVTSTALGIAAASPPAALVVGDIAFYHDMNGLLAAQRHRPHLLIVLVHNDGGGIFSYLPQSALEPDTFETLFGTPHGLEFRHAAALYGLPHAVARTWTDFRAAVATWLAAGGTHILEVPSDRARSAAEHRAAWAAAAEAVRACA